MSAGGKKIRRKQQYGAALKKVEEKLEAWQRALEQQQQQQQELREHCFVLADYVYAQVCIWTGVHLDLLITTHALTSSPLMVSASCEDDTVHCAA